MLPLRLFFGTGMHPQTRMMGVSPHRDYNHSTDFTPTLGANTLATCMKQLNGEFP
jgi:hypothetical protein